MRIAVIRGAYLNQAEMASYQPLVKNHQLEAFASLKPIDGDFKFKVTNCFSPMDIPQCLFINKKIKMAIMNRLLGDSMLLWGIGDFFRKAKNDNKMFDIIHTAETYFYYTQQSLDIKKKGYAKKVVVTVWENIPHNHEGIKKRKAFKKRTIQEADHFLAVTKQAKKALVSEGCHPRKVSVIPMGVDLDKFKPRFIKGTPCKSARGPLVILFVGRLEKEKGVWELLEAFRELKNNFQSFNHVQDKFSIFNFQLNMIGQGSQKEKLLFKIREWGLNNHVTIKARKYHEMPLIYQNADIFVLPSKVTKYWQEQFGMVLVEAMASCLPIVATSSGAIPEVVGDAAILVPAGDSQSLERGIFKLINNPSLQADLAKRGLERARKYFDAQKIAKEIEKMYVDIL